MEKKTSLPLAPIFLTFFSIYFIAFFLTSCTISINLTDTHGTASDVVDSDPQTQTDVSAKIPLSPF